MGLLLEAVEADGPWRWRAGTPDWAALATVLRRILDGERGESLLNGLDPIDTATVRETLARLA